LKHFFTSPFYPSPEGEGKKAKRFQGEVAMLTMTLLLFLSFACTAQQARYKTQIIEFNPRTTPAAVSGKGQLFVRSADDSLCFKNVNGTVICFGQATAAGDYSPWDTTATAIIQKDTTLNVGIGF